MHFLSGALPILLLHHLKLVAARALPHDSSSPICQDLRHCGDNIPAQLHRQFKMLNVSANLLFQTYVSYQNFNTEDVHALCNPHSTDFPAFNASRFDHQERAVQLFQIFVYLNSTLGNITQEQTMLNSNAQDLLDLLGNTTAIIKAVISNLTCSLCNHFHVTSVDLYYGKPARQIFDQKKKGCRVLHKYTQFISEVTNILAHLHRHGHRLS
ncbi:leukemia inhibitory factor isoform X2 [Lissotriton helveticus]